MIKEVQSFGSLKAKTADLQHIPSYHFKLTSLCLLSKAILHLQVKGKYFYLDPNAFEDKELLLRLSPADPNAAETVPVSEAESKH